MLKWLKHQLTEKEASDICFLVLRPTVEPLRQDSLKLRQEEEEEVDVDYSAIVLHQRVF